MASDTTPLKVVGYVRVGTVEQDDGRTAEAQARSIRLHSDLHGLDLVGVESDLGASGTTLDRPGLRAALARLESGEAAGLVVVNLDRLTRTVRDLDGLLEGHFAEGGGRELISIAEGIDTRTTLGRMPFEDVRERIDEFQSRKGGS